MLRRAGAGAVDVDVTLMLLNATDEDRAFTMPPPSLPWHRLLDSADASAEEMPVETDSLTIQSCSAALLVASVRP